MLLILNEYEFILDFSSPQDLLLKYSNVVHWFSVLTTDLHFHINSMLHELYVPGRPIMTYFHGLHSGSFIDIPFQLKGHFTPLDHIVFFWHPKALPLFILLYSTSTNFGEIKLTGISGTNRWARWDQDRNIGRLVNQNSGVYRNMGAL